MYAIFTNSDFIMWAAAGKEESKLAATNTIYYANSNKRYRDPNKGTIQV